MPDTSWTRTNTFLDTAGQKSQFFLKERVVFAKGECCLKVTTQGWTLQHLIVKRSCVRIFRGLWPASVFDSVRIFTSPASASHLRICVRIWPTKLACSGCVQIGIPLSLSCYFSLQFDQVLLSSSTKFFFRCSFKIPDSIL